MRGSNESDDPKHLNLLSKIGIFYISVFYDKRILKIKRNETLIYAQ